MFSSTVVCSLDPTNQTVANPVDTRYPARFPWSNPPECSVRTRMAGAANGSNRWGFGHAAPPPPAVPFSLCPLRSPSPVAGLSGGPAPWGAALAAMRDCGAAAGAAFERVRGRLGSQRETLEAQATQLRELRCEAPARVSAFAWEVQGGI